MHFDLLQFLQYVMSGEDFDDDDSIKMAFDKLTENEITKFDDLMLLNTEDLIEIGLNEQISNKLGTTIQLLKRKYSSPHHTLNGDLSITHISALFFFFVAERETEMENLYTTLTKMIEQRYCVPLFTLL